MSFIDRISHVYYSIERDVALHLLLVECLMFIIALKRYSIVSFIDRMSETNPSIKINIDLAVISHYSFSKQCEKYHLNLHIYIYTIFI